MIRSARVFTRPRCFDASARPYTTWVPDRAQSGTMNLRPIDKDPDRPKRPVSCYLRFARDVRNRNEVEKIQVCKNSSLVARMWRELPLDDKQKYKDAFLVEKQRFDEEWKEYVASGRAAEWQRPPEMPRVPRSGFIRFFTEYRKQNPEAASKMHVIDFGEAAGAAWRGLKPEQRKVFNNMYDRDKKKFIADMWSYKETGALDEWKDKVGWTRAQQKHEDVKVRFFRIRTVILFFSTIRNEGQIISE